MWETCYFLNIGNLTGEETAIVRKMEALLDKERLLKYQSLKGPQGKLLSLGAGALLRLAVMEYLSEGECKPSRRLVPQTLLALTEKLPKGREEENQYRYGSQGKPYFENIPLFFSLSHSGECVCLAVSEREIGADLQEIKQTNWEKLSERFYAEEEKQRLRSLCEKDPEKAREEFFRLWCLKEAYGKWSGEGVTPYLGICLDQKIEKKRLREGRLSCSEKIYRYAICHGELDSAQGESE